MRAWLEELTDELAALDEHIDDPETGVWARALARDLGQEGATDAILNAESVPPVVRRIALEELMRAES